MNFQVCSATSHVDFCPFYFNQRHLQQLPFGVPRPSFPLYATTPGSPAHTSATSSNYVLPAYCWADPRSIPALRVTPSVTMLKYKSIRFYAKLPAFPAHVAAMSCNRPLNCTQMLVRNDDILDYYTERPTAFPTLPYNYSLFGRCTNAIRGHVNTTS